jgi:UDP-N-acetylmuramoyl-L-alanyl-D-glutamate--2,6-diaminopimelate ligase
MVLSRLLEGVRVTKLFSAAYGKTVQTQELFIRAVQYDSRNVGRGDLFVAIRGLARDGHQYVPGAIEKGAAAVVVEDDTVVPDELFLHTGVVKIVVGDSRRALAGISANYYGHPSGLLMLVGVTGTNGKTTSTYLLKSILEAAGMRVGLLGTIAYLVGDEVLPATHTTPESLELNALLANMVTRGCTAAVMEVSSHSLALGRVEGLSFRAAVFTNLTQDHLDFHGSMGEYFRTKKMLFDSLTSGAVAVTNVDDPRGADIVRSTQAAVVRYGVAGPADVSVGDVRMSISGMDLAVIHGGASTAMRSRLTGKFNVANILASCAAAGALGIPWEAIRQGVEETASVRGRFEQVSSPKGWTSIIDYAHTPDALENCLRTVRDLLPRDRPGKVITVFGCGGDRDAGKRPIMGRIASGLSDVVVVTSDNPRSEKPERIIEQILAGILPGKDVRVEIDRRQAISGALDLAQRGDVIVIAGKGHETYQVLGDRRVHFDDREQVESYIRSHS